MTHTRGQIMQRVAEALNESGDAPPPCPDLPEAVVRQVFATDREELWSMFAQKLAELGDRAVRLNGPVEAKEWLTGALREHGIGSDASAVIDADAAALLDWTEPERAAAGLLDSAGRQTMLAARVGVSLVDFAVASTGTIAIAADRQRSRLTSLAPEIHYALLPLDRLRADMIDGLAGNAELGAAGAVVWITGSSRTADIEGILVHGAHGPKVLCVLAF